MPTVKTDFFIEQASVEEVQPVVDKHNEKVNKEESKSGVSEKYISVEQADLDLKGKTVVHDVSDIEERVAARS